MLVVELDNGVSLDVQIMALIAKIEDAPREPLNK